MAYGHTIAAISTPSGKGGVAIIRISGIDALAVAGAIFSPRKRTAIKELPRVQVYGDIIHCGERIDDGMATYFPAPNSYTGEDVVEISCHGGILITRLVLEAALTCGAHPADAGEFTRRAFINGKLSLSEAEAISLLLEAKSREQIRLTSATSRALLSDKLEDIRASLTDILSSTFARIDYPDEDLGEYGNEESAERLSHVKNTLEGLISTYPTGKAIRDGIKTVICGKPNVGKSTLYNAILGEDAAIVTDIEGTTRDVLTRSVPLGRVMLSLSDTAGVRDELHADTVEKIGIDRSLAEISAAELIVAVFDASRDIDDNDRELLAKIKESDGGKIAVINKRDMKRGDGFNCLDGIFDGVIEISAKTDATDAVSQLSALVARLFTDERINVGGEAVISSARHNAALTRCLSFVNAAISAYNSGAYADAAASEVERALSAISEIDGRAVAEEVVADIFSKFCVGK